MKIYLIMQSNGYGNSAVNSTWATRAEAEAECKRLQSSQERYDNDYYVVEKELQGDTCGFVKDTIYQRLELNRIDDCLNCPCHPWSVNYMPLTSCEFK